MSDTEVIWRLKRSVAKTASPVLVDGLIYMITDGADIGWWSYSHHGALDEIEVDLGAPPVGAGLASTGPLAPGFDARLAAPRYFSRRPRP